jgi:hypothetical protein
MRARTATAVAGIVASLAVSAVLWWYFGTVVFFLFVPFVPFLLRGVTQEPRETPTRECPVCGFQTTEESYDYCPRDGHRME